MTFICKCNWSWETLGSDFLNAPPWQSFVASWSFLSRCILAKASRGCFVGGINPFICKKKKKNSFQIVEQRWHLLATYSDLKVEFAYSPSGKCTLSSQTRPPQISRSPTFQAISWHHCAMHTILIKSGRKLCQSLSNRGSILVGRTLNITKGTMDPIECFCSSQKRMW